MDKTEENFQQMLKNRILAAGSAGVIADSVVYPLMTVKSRMMMGGSLYNYKGPIHALRTIAAKEGWRTLYKGYASVVHIAFSQALYMATYETTKYVIPGGRQSPSVQFCGGILATLAQSVVGVPLEVVRQRQMVQGKGKDAYKGSLDAAKRIYAKEGLGALYRGFVLAQMVWGPYNAIYLPLWEASKRLAARQTQTESVDKLGIQWELACSFCSASVASAVTNPMDVVKTRLQIQDKTTTIQYDGALDAAKKIWEREGLKGFCCGVSSRVLWVSTSCMVMFTTYDQISKRLKGAKHKE